jgi:Na+/proline symporter
MTPSLIVKLVFLATLLVIVFYFWSKEKKKNENEF